MAKLLGGLRLKGNLEGLTFYALNGEIIVRRSSGFTRENLKQGANYARCRQTSAEFAHCGRMSTYLRQGLQPQLSKTHYAKPHNQLVKVFQQILTHDTASAPGERTVPRGLQTAAGRSLLTHFEFDSEQPFASVVPWEPQWDAATATLSLSPMPNAKGRVPKGATHVGLQVRHLSLDASLAQPVAVAETPEQYYSLSPQHLAAPIPLPVPAVAGELQWVVLFVAYYQEKEGTWCPLPGLYIKFVGGGMDGMG
ncbi:hypothetical protein [Flavobacterium stagni]|uniref:Uncharacterized protein n=1 Tax=Flavobacterium stagni TaxID=2506421 RepID=A0A4Q1K9L1_9FLAO|nr:hypothetical protein [Flavobacterium stagni]RXR23048.1 hypothetical protein EQG61_07375 [Flavobacterium stagni]